MDIIQMDFYVSEPGIPFSSSVYMEPGAAAHWHKYWEILYQIGGRTQVVVDGEDFISIEGDVTIIRPEELHSTRRLSPEHRILLLQFDTSALMPHLSSLRDFQYISHIMSGDIAYRRHFRVTQEGREIRTAMETVLEEYGARLPGYELEVRAQLMHLFSRLIRLGYIEQPRLSGEKLGALKKVRNAILHIDNHYAEGIRLAEAAELCYMSEYNFCRVFKAATGKSMVEYLNYVRLKEAEALLITGEGSISETAQAVGFSNQSYFNRAFKKAYGTSPQNYRKQNRANYEQDQCILPDRKPL